MKVTDDLKQFLLFSQSLIGVNLLLTDMEKSIIEINRDGDVDLSERKINKELRKLKITETVLKSGKKEAVKLFEYPLMANAQMISPICHNNVQVGFLIYHHPEGEFDNKHREFADTARSFVEKFVDKYSETV